MNKLVLADNQSIFRTGIAKVLAVQDDFRIVAQCMDVERLYTAVKAFHGAIVIFTHTLIPEHAALVRTIHDASGRAILIAENNDTPQAHGNTGLDGLLFRDVSGPALVECVRRVAAGGTYVQSRFGRGPSDELDPVGVRVRKRLTPKELRIISLIVEGHKNKEIASQLGTTEQVIKNYLRNVYDKTGVSDRLELALFTLHHRVLVQGPDVASTSVPAAVRPLRAVSA